MKLRHLDLFSGIGGFSLAASWVWGEEHEIVGFCEINKFCQKVLRKHWPDVPIFEDIKELSGRQWKGTVDLITGGFPCQPFSVAGKQKGKADDRYLWPEYLRLIQEIRPRWVLGENVAGIVRMELDTVLSDLEGEGYSCQSLVIPACAVNAPHRRDRVWIVANNSDTGLSKSRFTGNKELSKENREGMDDRSKHEDSHASNPNREGLQGSQRPGTHDKGQTAHGSTPECNRTWDESWLEVATRLCRVDARVPGRVDRLRSLGNAIVPQVAYVIMKAIKEIDT